MGELKFFEVIIAEIWMEEASYGMKKRFSFVFVLTTNGINMQISMVVWGQVVAQHKNHCNKNASTPDRFHRRKIRHLAKYRQKAGENYERLY